MDDAALELLAGLNESFDAAVARDEEVAASDLARSLLRGADLGERLCRAGGVTLLVEEGARVPVAGIGGDHFVCGDPPFLLGRLDRNPFALAREGRTPARSAIDAVGIVGNWALREERVRVRTAEEGDYEGKLLHVRADHLVLRTPVEQHVVPMGLVKSIRLLRGG